MLAPNGTVVGIAWEYQPITQVSLNNPSNINHMLTNGFYFKTLNIIIWKQLSKHKTD